MGIYILDGETLVKTYINEEPKKIKDTQYVLISNSIRKNGKYKDQVVNANNILLPKQDLILDYDDYTSPSYQNAYREYINERKPFLATLIKYAIEEDGIVILLCSKREKKYLYLDMLKEFIEDEFDYPVYNYKKYKKGKEKYRDIDYDDVIKKCNKVLKKAKKDEIDKKLSTERGREEYFNSLSKSELKKELKKMDLYQKGMSKSEMIDMLDAFV